MVQKLIQDVCNCQAKETEVGISIEPLNLIYTRDHLKRYAGTIWTTPILVHLVLISCVGPL